MFANEAYLGIFEMATCCDQTRQSNVTSFSQYKALQKLIKRRLRPTLKYMYVFKHQTKDQKFTVYSYVFKGKSWVMFQNGLERTEWLF